MIMLIVILLISTGDGHGGKATAVIQQDFSRLVFAERQCEKIKAELELAYGSQVISSKCIRGY